MKMVSLVCMNLDDKFLKVCFQSIPKIQNKSWITALVYGVQNSKR